ncbi:hypothetical protein ACIBTV_25595 [Micromonospora sp. NPDC049366]|uniref:hypothetical protein n=1 Tax=Micromonospora sp. NPDC049366 TaxID=3364271 RepID=UPI0037BD6FBF
MKAFIDKTRQAGMTFLCWTSLVLAFFAGPLLAKMFIGETLRKLIEFIPWDWTPLVGLVILLGLFVADLLRDWRPNYLAIGAWMAMPSIASASNGGKLSGTVSDWTNAALDFVINPLKEWAGTSNYVGLALAVAALSIIFGQRTIKKQPDPIAVGW